MSIALLYKEIYTQFYRRKETKKDTKRNFIAISGHREKNCCNIVKLTHYYYYLEMYIPMDSGNPLENPLKTFTVAIPRHIKGGKQL